MLPFLPLVVAASPAATHVGAAISSPPAENVFPAGMLGFSSFRGTVLVTTPSHLVAFATGRHAGGDVSARNVVVRTSTMGGRRGSWSAPQIIANVSDSSLQAGDGLYTGTGVYDPVTKETQLFWGECLERCHPGQTGAHVMSAPTFMLTASTDHFKTWHHVNITAGVVAAGIADPEQFLPYNFFDNAAIIWPQHRHERSQWFDQAATHSRDDGISGWPASGLVLVGSCHTFKSNHGPPNSSNCSECAACCSRSGTVTYHSSDHGRTFRRGVQLTPPPAEPSQLAMVDEPNLGLLPDGTLIQIGHGDAESPGRNTLAMSRSTDNGRSWANPTKIKGLVQPGCGLGLLVDQGVIYISYDNNGTLATASPNAHDASRNNLTVSHSTNGGASWESRLVDPRFTGLSALAKVRQPTSNNSRDRAEVGTTKLGVLYEAGHKRFDGDGIWFATLPLLRHVPVLV